MTVLLTVLNSATLRALVIPELALLFVLEKATAVAGVCLPGLLRREVWWSWTLPSCSRGGASPGCREISNTSQPAPLYPWVKIQVNGIKFISHYKCLEGIH